MFSKLKKAINSIADSLVEKITTREIKEEELEEYLEEFKMELLENDVAYVVTEQISEELKKRLVGKKIERKSDLMKIIKETFTHVIKEYLKEPPRNVIEEAKKKCTEKKEPYIIMFMGVNGTGKTTSIAKLAWLYKKKGITPVIVAADTFRAGAQEQLEEHARKIGVPIIKAKYQSDPASVAFDAVAYSRKRNYCVVIVDTAGRMHTEKDLMEELKKIKRVIEPDIKILVVDALTGNDAVEQATTFNNHIGVDGFVLTKTDADIKGGTAISVIAETGKPILFVGTGQSYDDLEKFTVEWLINKILD